MKSTKGRTPAKNSKKRLSELQKASKPINKRKVIPSKGVTTSKKKAASSNTVKPTKAKIPNANSKIAKKTSTIKAESKRRNSTTSKKKTVKTAKKASARQPSKVKQSKNSDKEALRIKRQANLTPFKPGISGNPKGRPKKVLTRFSELGYSKSEVRDNFSAMAGMTKAELDEVINDKDSTVLEILTAQEYKQAIKAGKKRGGYKSSTKNMIEMFADKATQRKIIDVDPNLKHSSKSDEELASRIQELRDKIGTAKGEIVTEIKAAKKVIKRVVKKGIKK